MSISRMYIELFVMENCLKWIILGTTLVFINNLKHLQRLVVLINCEYAAVVNHLFSSLCFLFHSFNLQIMTLFSADE